ncbi:substrate-binding periplasmic protein [Vreelandella sp. EE22]
MTTMMLSSTQVTANPAPSYHLTINTEDYPPFNFERDGVVVGRATHRLRDALAQTGIEAQFFLLPWTRAYTEARLRHNHCVYSTTRTPEREALFRWAGPLGVNEWAALSLEGRFDNLEHPHDLKGLRVGSIREDAVGDYIESQGINVLRASSEWVNVARLKAGLVDVIVTGRATAAFLAREQHISLQHLFTFAHMPLYLACHPSVPHQVMARLQRALKAQR